MTTKQERYAEKQRRAAARRGGQPTKTKRQRRKKKMERRRTDGWNWDTTYYDFRVRITLPDVDLNVGVKAQNPENAAKLALFEHREVLLKKVDDGRVRATVEHHHRGLVADEVFEIPEDDSFLPKPKEKVKKPVVRGNGIGFPGVFAALARARQKTQADRAREAEAKFQVEEIPEAPSFPGVE